MHPVFDSTIGLFSSTFLLYIAHGLLAILIPLSLNESGTSTVIIGLVQSSYYVGGIIGFMTSSYFIKRSSHIRSFSAAAGIFALCALVLSQYENIVLWALVRLVTGFALSLAATSIESWLQDVATPKNRSQILAIYMIVYALAIALGQLSVAFETNISLFLFVNLFAVAAILPLSFSKVTGPDYRNIASMKLGDLLRDSPLGVIGSFVYGLSFGAMFSIGSIFAIKIGLSLTQVSVFMFSMVAGGFFLQYPVGKISDRYDRRLVLIFILFFSMLTNFIILNLLLLNPDFQAAGNQTIIFLFASIVGGTTSLIYPLCLAASFDWIKKEQIVSATKLCAVSAAGGSILAPILSSIFIEGVGPKGLLIYFMIAEGSLIGYVVYRKIVRKSKPIEEQGSFVMLPKNSSLSAMFLEDHDMSKDTVEDTQDES